MEKENNTPTPLHKRRAFIPLASFLGVLLVLLLSTRMTGRPPVVESVTPHIGYPGDVMVITGKYFADARNGGRVVIAGYSPVSSGYLEWTDTQISLRIPEDVHSGLVRVVTRNGESKGQLFTNREQIPVVISGTARPGLPTINTLNPQSGPIGSVLTLNGMNFGLNRSNSKVFFTWVSGEESLQYNADQAAAFIPAVEYDQDYLSWNDREIQVRVPDGAFSGHLVVRTDKGESSAVYFEVEGDAGTKLYPEKRTFAVQYSVQIRDITASGPNNLYLWVPQILAAPEQREFQQVSEEPAPLFADVNGVKLFRLENLETNSSATVLQSVMFDRYSVETKINSARLPASYDESRKLYKKFTAYDGLIPSEDERIKELGQAIVGRERNPYRKARAIYYWILQRLLASEPEEVEPYDILAALDARKADSYIYAGLFCALARSVGIPSRPVAGYLVELDLNSRRHYWAEFYLENVGWIPVDVYLGEGKLRAPLAPEIDPTTYYFGNLDFSHLALSKGVIQLNQMDPEGRAVRRPDIPSLQSVHEEASGGLESYSAYWSDIEVLGIY
jgi:transglutaminase-like putative cysteine protease